MDTSYAKELLVILIGNVAKILNKGFGVNHAEPSLFQVLNLLNQESDLKDKFLEMVRFTLFANDPGNNDQGMVPVELIELVAHELRWPELKEIANDRINSKFNADRSLAIGDVSMRIYDAFSDEWEDRVFYTNYQS